MSVLSTQTGDKFNLTAIVIPCDLPVQPVTTSSDWKHLTGLTLADLDFGRPGRIDLLGVDIFTEALLHGRRIGLPGTPVAFETVLYF